MHTAARMAATMATMAAMTAALTHTAATTAYMTATTVTMAATMAAATHTVATTAATTATTAASTVAATYTVATMAYTTATTATMVATTAAATHMAAMTAATTVTTAATTAAATHTAATTTTAATTAVKVAHSTPVRRTCPSQDEDDIPGGRYDDANKSVHYHHHFNGDSCHGPIDHVSFGVLSSPSICSSNRIPPPWVRVFSKSTQPSSLRTQAVSIAHIEQPVHKKARHRCTRRAKKKFLKQKKLLTEVILPHSIKQNLLSASDIEKEIVIVDGGDDGNPPIRPPEGVNWCSLSIREGIHLHVQDETDPFRGLTFRRVDGALPFAWLPRRQSLDTIQKKIDGGNLLCSGRM
jgi:hypothetical protein